jgi:SpoVK/Ycf46/Vps4 family AAA+-type ATPase
MPYILPKLYVRSKAILMYGPPGTGKTKLAEAAAAEMSRDEYGISVALFLGGGAEFKSKWVGGTEKRIKRYFECAQGFADDAIQECITRKESEALGKESKLDVGIVRQAASEECRAVSVLFLDEIDAIASKRDAEGKDASTTNTLIAQMEGKILS